MQATCHPERPRKLADGTCDRCYARERYRNDPDVRERTKAIARKSWHKRKPELTPEQKRVRLDRRNERYHKDPAYKRTVQSRVLEYTVGVTLDEYDKMLEDQGGACAICEQPPANTKRLAVDHDHDTGKVRGLLCARCNGGLGLFRDSTDLLRRAANYLGK